MYLYIFMYIYICTYDICTYIYIHRCGYDCKRSGPNLLVPAQQRIISYHVVSVQKKRSLCCPRSMLVEGFPSPLGSSTAT